MAIQFDYLNLVMTVLQADLTLISGTLYELDTNAFRLEVEANQATEVGIAFKSPTQHSTEVVVAGITYSRVIEIINNWKIKFEDLQYTVRLDGSNNNFFDVEAGILVQNQVSVIPTNSAGLQVVAGAGTSLTAQETRDSMKLAPTGGAPAAGSVDEHLDEIVEDTGTTIPGTLSSLSTQTSVDDIPNNSEFADRTLLAANYATDANQDITHAGIAANLSAVNGLNDYNPAVDEVETGVTYKEGQRLMLAESAGKVSVSGTTVIFRDVNDTKDRITAIVDNDGQRTAVTVDGS